MSIQDTPFIVIMVLAAVATTFALALVGEPQSVWLMRDVLGVM